MMLHAHTTLRALPEKEYFEFIDSLPEFLDTEAYNNVALTSLTLAEANELNNHDPFGVEYRKICENLYAKLSNNDRYTPELNERSRTDLKEGIWKASAPYSFKSTSFVSEFLTSWASIFSALDLKSGQSVLEYGAGSGQILLMLARTGIEAFGVDIDLDSLNLVRRQAEAMDLTIGLEQGEFGQGFGSRKFDAILFFESFHHALKFDDLLVGLHDRLLPGGRLVLCGEPVVEAGFPSVPYPWGPRLDGLSVFCMRRYGWMELGFQKDFLVEAMMRSGWLVRSRPGSVFRANTFIAERTPETIELGSYRAAGRLGRARGVASLDHCTLSEAAASGSHNAEDGRGLDADEPSALGEIRVGSHWWERHQRRDRVRHDDDSGFRVRGGAVSRDHDGSDGPGRRIPRTGHSRDLVQGEARGVAGGQSARLRSRRTLHAVRLADRRARRTQHIA